MRSEKELLIATRAFASEDRFQSWWTLFSTLFLYALSFAICCSSLPLSLRIATSIVSGLLIVRLFIVYHDFQHQAILGKSILASSILNLYGILVLSPPSVWNRSHDHHHKHNSKGHSTSMGSFPTMSCQQFAESSWAARLGYIVARHPLTIAMGYLTIFMGGMCIRALWINPRLHKDAGLALVIHVLLLCGLFYFGWDKPLVGIVIPLIVACGLGSYLFYAQHNFPGCQLHCKEDWTHAGAALRSSSYLKTNPVFNWFTGNIGYHHIHHLNAKIPFYRLPEVMRELGELQKPASTTLSPRDVLACFRANLWDPTKSRFVSYHEARQSPARCES